MRTFQAESRKKARKLIAERLMGSSPVWLSAHVYTGVAFDIKKVLDFFSFMVIIRATKGHLNKKGT